MNAPQSYEKHLPLQKKFVKSEGQCCKEAFGGFQVAANTTQQTSNTVAVPAGDKQFSEKDRN